MAKTLAEIKKERDDAMQKAQDAYEAEITKALAKFRKTQERIRAKYERNRARLEVA